MPIISVTTTAADVFFGDDNVDSINFKNGGTAGTIYLRNKQIKSNVVTSSDYEWSLPVNMAFGLTKVNDGDGIAGPWQAISDTAGGVNLEVLPVFKPGKGRH